MNLPAALDVAIGLIVLYVLLSTVCSFAVELIAVWFWWRKRLLYRTIGRLLTGDSDLKAPKRWCIPFLVSNESKNKKPIPTDPVLTAFWNHPLVAGLSPDKSLPSYIEASTFAAVVIDIAVPGAKTGTLPSTSEGLERIIRLATHAEDPAVDSANTAGDPGGGATQVLNTRTLRSLRNSILSAFRACGLNRPVIQATLPVDDLRTSIEKWYNEAMERSSLQYKRWAQGWLLGIGFLLTVVLNADTVRAVYVLSTSDTLRSAAVGYATISLSQTNAVVSTNSAVNNLLATNEMAVAELKTNLVSQVKELQRLQQLGFPLGWKSGLDWDLNFKPYDAVHWFWKWLTKIVGMLATACAISLGAPFWYDLLTKLVKLRGSRDTASVSDAVAKKTDTSTAILPLNNPMIGAAPAEQPPTPGNFATDMGDGRLEFSSRKAYWLAEAALLAYSAKTPIQAAIEPWGLDIVHYFENVQACQGFLAVTKDQKIAVLAFRGTEKTLEDWHTDANFTLVPSPTGEGQTHQGFTGQLDMVYTEITRKLKEHLKGDTLLYLTGHSLGAALATLAAARLSKDKACGVHSLHTFGSPRVGDRDFAKHYQLSLGHCTFRVVNGEDLVTRVPPRFVPTQPWKYDHVGHVVFFDSDGRMHLNAGFWDRFLNTLSNAVEDFRRQMKSSLKDHSMELYVRLLKNTPNQKD